jgi:hypothetical protein
MAPHEDGPRRRDQRKSFQRDARERALRQAEFSVALAEHTATALRTIAGPDHDYDQELFADAAADLEDQETTR